jgi:hypothetical protein
MKKEKISKIDIYKIESEYCVKDIDVFSDYSEKLLKTLKILNDQNIITPTDKRIFCLYLELGSLRKTGKFMKLSYENIRTVVNDVKNKIKENGNF